MLNRKKFFYLLFLVPVLLVLTLVYDSPRKLLKEVTNSPYDTEILIGNTKIDAEVASGPEKLTKGLSGRESIKDGQGLLFNFSYPDTFPTFWMKDMRFAIDIIWINDGKIIHIDKDVQPPKSDTQSSELKLYRPPAVIDYILEVKAGFSDKGGISVGDPVDLDLAITTPSVLR